MGRKQIWQRKFIHFCIACLTPLLLFSCAIIEEGLKKEEQKEAREQHLLRAKELFSQGNYEGSLKENQQVLSLSGKNPPGDEALFNMGLIYAHHKNPKKDYRKSLGLFRRLLTDYPKSPLGQQAEVWAGVLQEIEKSKQVDIEIEEKKKEMSR